MQLQVFFGYRCRPPAFFCQPDSMLSSNSSFPSNHLAKQLIQSSVHSLLRFGVIRVRHHNIYVDVPVASMPEAGHRKTETLLELVCKPDQIHNSSSRNSSILT